LTGASEVIWTHDLLFTRLPTAWSR